jgi:hypothetical protein
MKPPSVKSVRCAIYTRTADSQITTSSGRWARDIAYATPSRTMMVIAVAPHAARYATAAFLFGEPRLNAPNRKSRSGKCAHQAFAKSNRR